MWESSAKRARDIVALELCGEMTELSVEEESYHFKD